MYSQLARLRVSQKPDHRGPRPASLTIPPADRMKFDLLTGATLVALFSRARASPQPGPPTAGPFTYDNRSFFLHGQPFTIIGGQMDPQRIPPEYWRDRLASASAMGLNTIFSYVYWNLLEPEPGEVRSFWSLSILSGSVIDQRIARGCLVSFRRASPWRHLEGREHEILDSPRSSQAAFSSVF